MAAHQDSDNWELINDDGFVHKRRKRPSPHPAVANPPMDPSVERRHRREQKKRALSKLRDKYSKEISRWDLISNMLKEMEQNTPTQSVERQIQNSTPFNEASGWEEQSPSYYNRRRVIGDLLYQVEAQEAIILEISNLCDVAESLCDSREGKLKNQLSNLPIWESSPRELLASLCQP